MPYSLGDCLSWFSLDFPIPAGHLVEHNGVEAVVALFGREVMLPSPSSEAHLLDRVDGLRVRLLQHHGVHDLSSTATGIELTKSQTGYSDPL